MNKRQGGLYQGGKNIGRTLFVLLGSEWLDLKHLIEKESRKDVAL